jgi:hypothetical protein
MADIAQNFIPRLKDHLLSRLLNRDYDGDEQEFSDDDPTRYVLLIIACIL